MKAGVVSFVTFFVIAMNAQASSGSWSVDYLDRILASVQPGQRTARVGDMEILLSNLRVWRDRLAGVATPLSAFDGTEPTWTGGNIYYTFDTNSGTAVPAAAQKVFFDGAGEWASFANLHFIPWTTQSNYVFVTQQASLEGGHSAVGMIGGQQTLSIGPTSWNHATVCHELGHTLGLVHEHQRSDRDSYVTVFSNNVEADDIGNFIILANSRNQTAYDFLSIMHYNRNSFSIDPATLDTIEPLPAYREYLNIMGEQYDPVLSVGDRAGMASVYGAPAVPPSNVVVNTQDSGPGSLRVALYYAFDHPGTTITFNIPVSDLGYSNQVFNIVPTDRLPSLVHATTLDGATEPVRANAPGPSILLNGALAQPPQVYCSGLRLGGTNCAVRSVIVDGFSEYGIAIDSTNAFNNTVTGCYLGVDATGSTAATNNSCPLAIDCGASGNTVGGVSAAERNVLSGSYYQGLVIRDPGTHGNRVIGNYIGLNAAGSSELSNRWAGIDVFFGAVSNLIMSNVISGNGAQGILIQDVCNGNQVTGNWIGTDPSGEVAIPNRWAGVEIYDGPQFNLIGPGNVISGNGNEGVFIDTFSATNSVVGNFIGVDAAGTRALPNGYVGVELYSNAIGNVIGGVTAHEGNVLSGNTAQGIIIDTGSSGNVVQGNYIGLNAAGMLSVPNGFAGVELYNNATGNWIGGGIGARNFISGNSNVGVAIDKGSSGNVVQGNAIGVNVFYGAAPNAYQGVSIFAGAQANLIGGVTLGAANLIAGNTYDGVDIFDSASVDNSVRGNSIVGNGGGIGLYNGGNLSAAAPTLIAAVVSTNLSVSGSLASTANMTFHIDFYASPPAAPQASVYLGTRDVTTEAGGSIDFGLNFGATVPEGHFITAVATDLGGNSSGLSTGIIVNVTDTVGDGIPNAWRAAYFGGNGAKTNGLSCALCDPDHDGLSNYEEFLAGTNPTNAASALRLGIAGLETGLPTLEFQSTPGTVYRIDYKNTFDTDLWGILVDQIPGSGGLIRIPDLSATSVPDRFYQLLVLP